MAAVDDKDLGNYKTVCVCMHWYMQYKSLCIIVELDDDLEDVLEAVKSLANEWKKLLRKLHIKQDTIDVIDRNNPGDAELCLQVGLSKWLKMNYNYRKHGMPSWRMLAEAVSNFDNRLSKKIAKDHPKK